jgi:endonuclease G, mitochondrial
VIRRTGFNPNFMGREYEIPFPTLTNETAKHALNNGEVFHFTHFSIVMNQKRKFAIYTANNIDQHTMKDIRRENDDWHFDPRIGQEHQIGNEWYQNNPWDRGHLVRRKDVCWGSVKEAKQANYDTFCWANIALQHHECNTGPWNELEDWILDHRQNLLKKLSVFTGPINMENDPEYCGAGKPLGCGIQIPAGFWKVVFYVNEEKKLCSASFMMKQDHYTEHRLLNSFTSLQPYQVALKTISQLTDIQFDERLYETDVLHAVPVSFDVAERKRYLIEEVEDFKLA